MRRIILFLLLVPVFLCSAKKPKEIEDHSIIMIPSHAVYEGDYFAAGDSIEISGIVNGDVYLIAGQVVVDGVINGDLICCAGSVDISGRVSNNARLLAGQVLLSGEIGRNITAVGGNVQLLKQSSVGKNVVITAGNADLAARIGSEVTAVASHLRVSSTIGQDLHAVVGLMRLTSQARISGDVDYRSNSDAWIDQGATVVGTITQHPSFVRNLVKGTWMQKVLVGSKLLTLSMNFLYSLAIAYLLLRLFPRNLQSALLSLRGQPWRSLSTGLITLIVLPLCCLLLLMTVLGVPFALTLIALNIVGFYTAKVYFIFWGSDWLSSKIKWRIHRLAAFAVGLIAYLIISSIPGLGKIFSLAAMVFGLGAAVTAQTKRYHAGL
ncbi:polymer-forming cytoskeletal protein [Candidatus Rhabdochlamydia sp. T3358]|uniref:polymer-forming cytoskeletal protein n=1 Tax=Candidatus Rhabdochlamydia sp. T3358 TaxID=2099795 RepID=UPI0010B2DEEA|nr:polymer-forming cytoskeletal protein [Candidatus Rhabdochlamydia sp. T3358]VHO03990.1 hypothetical protein RHT_01154 [Candidatus Rhabdochlamydia sp. T3358]